MAFEVDSPILNSPFAEPVEYWFIRPGHPAERRAGRRPALVFQPRDQRDPWDVDHDPTLAHLKEYERAYELRLVNQVRQRLAQWQRDGRPGATRVSQELIGWWRREGRAQRLFFAQMEAVETVIFLKEARADYLQGLEIPRDEAGAEAQERGYTGFLRYACKMATGGGKTTVMGMVAAWSILNKQQDRANATYSDVVLVVCPNVTIKDRLEELKPERGDASLYRTRDLVPPHLMPVLTKGRVIVTNWHVFEPHTSDAGDVSARVVKTGVRVTTKEWIRIAEKTTTARNLRYMTPAALEVLVAAGAIRVLGERRNREGQLEAVEVERERYVESDTAVITRVLGREAGGRQNILVMNDEAHHAYRIQRDDGDEELFEGEDEDEFYREATVWVEGLDRVNKLRGINFCLDLSATPYYLGRMGGMTGRPFPWVVSDFGLIDAIESGLVKIPQLALQDTSGQERPDYFNIWDWIVTKKLTPAEKGGKRGSPKPEAVLKYAHAPIAILAGQWREEFKRWQAEQAGDPRPPVFIIVCKNTNLAKVVYEWLAEDNRPEGIPSSGMDEWRNTEGAVNTIRVDTKVVHDTDRGESASGSKADEMRWMRFTLDTVGKQDWSRDAQGRAVYPEGFEELAKKLGKPLTPPGAQVRCIVSVAMLTEGWDANTVTHIVGLRPFMSQLLCEQVVGRGLRRRRYDIGEDDKFGEEVAQVLGVPFEVIPFKANEGGAAPPPKPRYRVYAVPEKAQYEIRFPRVEGYTQQVSNRISVDWDAVATLEIDPARIPVAVDVGGALPNTRGRMSAIGSNEVKEINLDPYQGDRRLQALEFELARDLTRNLLASGKLPVPAGVLFPQFLQVTKRYVADKVLVTPPNTRLDLWIAPYYGLALERLHEAIRPADEGGKSLELPQYERGRRRTGSTVEVDAWTSKPVLEVHKCHLNLMVAHTQSWEQQVAQRLDKHPKVLAFVKNEFLSFAIPYLFDGQDHEYYPDFLVRLDTPGEPLTLIIEVKGRPDPQVQEKRQAAERWCAAVNAEGSFGRWGYAIVRDPKETTEVVEAWTSTAGG